MEDVKLTITIPSDKVAILTPWYLAEWPIPQIPDPDNLGEMIDQYRLKKWLELLLMNCGSNTCDQIINLGT